MERGGERDILLLTPLPSERQVFDQDNKSVHSCLELAILIKISTKNPGQKSVVLEYSANHALAVNLAAKDWFDKRFKN